MGSVPLADKPAEELEEFNAHSVGLVELVETHG
jgi:hypothetical protein